jgi:hypothetical protein
MLAKVYSKLSHVYLNKNNYSSNESFPRSQNRDKNYFLIEKYFKHIIIRLYIIKVYDLSVCKAVNIVFMQITNRKQYKNRFY